ncbi:hypothetical protein EG328_007910 [Venturia inaequalis]|uniref:Uncharacterized protein n=1 Tax=Venturia inaequalis TaxID=5025 RepID=A0A8H3UCC7_VENIN|nr:hypothetical protein EG328_007910 [Venturia inaequalis]
MTAIIPSQKSYKIETGNQFPPSIPRQGVKRSRYWYGPYEIRALNSSVKLGNGRSGDPGGTAWNYIGGDLPKDITLLSANVSVVYADGSLIGTSNGLYNHHLLVVDLSKKPPTIATCPSGRGAEPPGLSMWAGSSEDKGGSMFTTDDGKFNSGYYVGKDDKVTMAGDIVNFTNEKKIVYTMIDIQYVEGKPEGHQEAVTQLWNVGQCEGEGKVGFDIPKPRPDQKKFALRSQNMTMVQDGTFLAFRGHLHEGGTEVIATLNGVEVCRSGAIYSGPSTTPGDQGALSAMQYCNKSIRVKKGDVMTLEANYDLELHPPRMQHGGGMAGEMGIMSIFFAAEPTKAN